MNAKIIRLIARDENVHLAATQVMIRMLKKEDPDFAKIAVECEEEVQQMFMDVVEQEEKWAEYLFKDGSIIGMNEEISKQYVRWIASKRMGAVGIKCPYSVPKTNPLPWTTEWISSADVQVAPQETELSSYIIGGLKNDVDSGSFNNFKL